MESPKQGGVLTLKSEIPLIALEHVEAVADVLKERIGHSLGNTDPKFLRKFLSERFKAHACLTAEAYLPHLDEPAEFRIILDGLTVPETFFFRFEAQLEAFKKVLLPQLAKTVGPKDKLRIWSAGCCTGEEPYTLALLAAELGLLDRVEILGTDINPTYLERAENPTFSDRSVSRVPPTLLRTYFQKGESGWTLVPEILRAVTFRQLNLNENSFPSPINGTTFCHVIYCRNVLIYFSQGRATDIINRLGTCLVPGGYLALGHAEFNFTPSELTLQRVDGAFFFQRPKKEDKKAAPLKVVPDVKKPKAKKAEVPQISEVKRLAEQGKVAEAVALCQKIVSADPLNSEAYFFEGFLARENPARASELFRKVLYLDPNHLLARLELARSFELEGRPADAVREYRELLRQTSQLDPSQPIPAGDGITVGLLAILCQRALQKLEVQAA